MKYIILCLVFLFVENTSNRETILWNRVKKLTWADFKANPNSNSDAVALTASGITFSYSIKTSNTVITGFSSSVEAHFYPNKSWYLKTKKSDFILRHEQLHFDITELYAREFRKELAALPVNQNIKSQLKKLHTLINKVLDETQKRYDTQSQHSINIEAQNKWEDFIERELKKLDTYKLK